MVIEPSALILTALLLLTLPLQWLLAAFTAAAVHELGHYLCLLALGGRAGELRLTAGGAVLQIGELSPGREAVCALAGPLAGGLLSLLWPWFPRLALCAMIQTVFNLLPVRPLDGGRALCCALTLLGKPHWQSVIEAALCVIMAPAALGGGLLPGALWLAFVLRMLRNRFPEKFLAK